MKWMKALEYSNNKLVDGGTGLYWVERVPWEDQDSKMKSATIIIIIIIIIIN